MHPAKLHQSHFRKSPYRTPCTKCGHRRVCDSTSKLCKLCDKPETRFLQERKDYVIKYPLHTLPEPGQKLLHRIFGKGITEQVNQTGTYGPTIRIRFDTHGVKQLQWDFAKRNLGVIHPGEEKP